MKPILLTHSFFLRNDSKQAEKMRPYPPLGTLYAAANLRRQGHPVVLFDSMLSAGPDEFAAVLATHRPDIVVLYEDQFHFLNKMCLSHVREAACRMSRMAADRGSIVIAAGADVSDNPEEYFEHGVKFALMGEADHSLCELVDHLRHNSMTLEQIDGIAIPTESRSVTRTRPRKQEPDPDVFSFPAWDLCELDRYRQVWKQAHGFFSLNIATTRGCPFHCNWCAKPIWGQNYAMRSPANVAEELALLKHEYEADHIWFADDIFGLQPKWVIEFAREVEQRDAAVPFMIQSRTDLMTVKTVDALRRAGCKEVWLGVESGSQKILNAMDKGLRTEKIPIARQRLKRAGIKTCFFLQFGYPGEELTDIKTTVDMVRRTLPDDIGISVSYPLPGTKFNAAVGHELGQKTHWTDSDELAMMFQGTFDTDFYRRLHRLLHRDLELRQELTRHPDDSELSRQLEEHGQQWSAFYRSADQHRSPNPTRLA